MIHFVSLSLLLLPLTAEAQRSGCDLKDAECVDEKQVFFQVRSELRDSKDSDLGMAAHPRWRWRRRNRRYHPYHPYGPSTSTTTSTTTSIPVCGLIGNNFGAANFTTVDLPANVNVTVLVEIPEEATIGCCVQDNPTATNLDVSLSNPARLGNLTVFLETPDMQSKEVGVAFPSDNSFNFFGNLFPGAVVSGVWTITLLASPDAVGWSSRFSQIAFFLDQC